MYVEILGEGHPAAMNMYVRRLKLNRRLEHEKGTEPGADEGEASVEVSEAMKQRELTLRAKRELRVGTESKIWA
jgi:hypothetical protein